MIAIAYSGSKESFWKISTKKSILAETNTANLNPYLNNENDLLQKLDKNNTLVSYADRLKKIFVFSAGANTLKKRNELQKTLSIFFKKSKIEVHSDLFGAAIASCGKAKGIVCVLGSGSNCAYFDGEKIEDNNNGLGYILGDEGAASYLGRLLLKNFLEKKMPEDLAKDLEKNYLVDKQIILDNIYKNSRASEYLASFLNFIVKHRTHDFIENLIKINFKSFFDTYLLPTLKKYPKQDIYFVGSVADTFSGILTAVAQAHQLTIKNIIKSPINNLTKYYQTNKI
ncbi:MAG: hypothetical protein K2Q03_09180 [Sphingobacteriaceae bacterium]|nr:hypothetical protein [Sphingobacteriaceae bacterium]